MTASDGRPLIDRDWLQRIQDYFADVSGLFLFALDEQGRQITDISGRDMRETNRIAELINQRQVDELFKRVMQTRLEEQIIENTEFSNMKMAAISIKSGNTAVFCFMVCAVYYEPDGESAIFNIRSIVDENIFYGGLDFLREICDRIYANSLLLENAKQESEQLRANEQMLEKALRQSESLTQIVQLLDSEDRFSGICDEIAEISARTVGISHAYVIAPGREGDSVDLIARYRSENANPVIERVNRRELLHYMDVVGDKPMVVSSRTEIDYDFRLWLGSIGVIGFVALPIFSGRPRRKLCMHIIFADNDPTRLWSREDVKFFGDVAKVLQSIYDRRTNKASLTSSYNSLQVILDNVGSCVFVKDAVSGEVLFRNRSMNETFKDEIKNGSLAKLIRDAENKDQGLLSGQVFKLVYPEKGRSYQVHSARMEWVTGRAAVMYSLFEVSDKTENREKTAGKGETEPAAMVTKELPKLEFPLREEQQREPESKEMQEPQREPEPSLREKPQREAELEVIQEPLKKPEPPVGEEPHREPEEPQREPEPPIKQETKPQIKPEPESRIQSSPLPEQELSAKEERKPEQAPGTAQVLYEPVIDIIKGNICVGVEALAREASPEGERELLLMACRSLKEWNGSGRPYLKLYIGLNTVTKEMAESVIRETGVTPGNLTVELPESSLIEDRERTKKLLSQLKELGCRTGIFDFGSGKLLLESIKDLPVDVISLSAGVAKDLPENSYAESFIRMTGMLADYMKLTLCLKGIDTKESFEKLNGMNIRFVQGRFFDGSMTKEAFELEYM